MNIPVITAPRASCIIYGVVRAAPRGVWLLPANVCPAVPLALLEARVEFEFLDINPSTLCLDVEATLLRDLNHSQSKVAGVIYVHTYGHAPTPQTDLERLKSALPSSAVLVDDRALCIPETDISRQANNPADVVVYSTGPTKIINLGEGGYGFNLGEVGYWPATKPVTAGAYDLVTAQYKSAIEENKAAFTNINADNLPNWVPPGSGLEWENYKSRIEMSLPRALAEKKAINKIYLDGLAEYTLFEREQQWWRFNIQLDTARSVLEALFDAGLFASQHYYPASLLWGNTNCPHSLALHQKTINLFNDAYFDKERAQRVVDIIRNVVS